MRHALCILACICCGFGLAVMEGCGGSSATGPAGGGTTPQNTPAELVGLWSWSSVQYDSAGTYTTKFSYDEISFTDTSTAQDLEFFAGGTWRTREYYHDQGVVYTRSGTCYEDDSLYITCTNDNGTAMSGECIGYTWIGPTSASIRAADPSIPPAMQLSTRIKLPSGFIIIARTTYLRVPTSEM